MFQRKSFGNTVFQSKGVSSEVINEKNFQIKPSNTFIIHGMAASVLLAAAYFIIVSLIESFDHALTTFASLAYLFIPLIISFGVQIALFSYARQQSKIARQKSASITSTGSMSTVSMILCCVHHVSDIAVFVGLAAVTLFFTTYQPVFILIGLVSNVIGILTVLMFMQKNALYSSKLTGVMRLNLSKTRKFAAIGAVIIVILAFAVVGLQQGGGNFALPSKTIMQRGLTIVAAPQPFKFGDAIKINLTLDTHDGDFNYDLTRLAKLQDSNGTIYIPTGWAGPSPSGHHASGTLTFQPLNNQSSSMNLLLEDVNGINWDFGWILSN